MIWQRKSMDYAPYMGHYVRIEYVCSCCGNVMEHRPKTGKCTSCKR